MSSAYLVVSEGSSNKFWSIKVDGSKTTVSYGKIGAAGQTQEKDHGSSENAKKFAEKMIREKEKKGYERSSEGSAEKGKKRQAKRGKGSDDDGDGSESSDAEEDGDDGDEEPKPKRSAVEIAAAAKLEAVVREKLAPHRSALLADLQKLAATGTFKKADKVLFEIQPDGLQHPGFPVVAFLHTEDGDEMPNDVDLLKGIPTLLPEEELRKAYPEKVDMEGESGEGSFEVQSKALAVWLADCYKELGLNKRKPHAVIALHDDNMVLDTRTLKWREDDD